MMESEAMPDEQIEDEGEIGQPVADLPAPPTSDAFTALFDLLALAVDPRAVKVRLQGLHRALIAVDEGQARLAADRAVFDQHETVTRAELDEQIAAVERRRVAVYTAEQDLQRREAQLQIDCTAISRQDKILKRRAMAIAHMGGLNEGLQDLPPWQQLIEALAGASHFETNTEPEMAITDRVENAPQHLTVRQTFQRKVPRSSRRVQAEI
jgi:hypothetical protein